MTAAVAIAALEATIARLRADLERDGVDVLAEVRASLKPTARRWIDLPECPSEDGLSDWRASVAQRRA